MEAKSEVEEHGNGNGNDGNAKDEREREAGRRNGLFHTRNENFLYLGAMKIPWDFIREEHKIAI